MPTPNWHVNELDHEFHVYMVDPLDHSSVLGELEAYADSGSITWSNGNGDGVELTASLEIPDWTKWIDGTWLRVVHRIPSYSYSRILGTFMVWDEGASGGLSTFSGSPELVGVFRGIEYDYMPYILAVGEGASLKTVIARVMDATPVPYRFAGNFKDYRFTEPYVLDAGESRLEVMRQLCSLSGNLLKSGDEGYVLIEPKPDLVNKAPVYIIDCDSPDSIVFEGSVSQNSDKRQIAGRSIAIWNGREDEGAASLSGYSDVNVRHFASPQRRGYVVSEVHDLEDLPEPKTSEHVEALARRWLKEDSTATISWSIETMWLPLENGDVVSFRPSGGTFRNCVVETIEANLSSWTTSLTLKEV